MGTGAFKHDFPDIRRVGSKREALIDRARGQRVLHVGCTDAPFTADKLRSGDLLHRELLDVASWVGGVDVDADGLDMLRRELRGEYFCTDVCFPDQSVHFPEFDVIIAGDVVEHVPNEGAFLSGLARIATMYPRSRVLLSTPNALATRHLIYSAMGTEVIHPDHRRVHTPQTLRYACESSGLRVISIATYNIHSGDSVPRKVVDVVSRALTALRPGTGDGLIVEAMPTDR